MIIQSILQLMQQLYRVSIGAEINRYIIGDEQLSIIQQHYPSLKSDHQRECLIVLPGESGMEVALYIEPSIFYRLQRRSLRHGLTEGDLDDLCVVIEGISHLLLTITRAQREMPTTQLEMELQAEVDKFVIAYLLVLAACKKRAPELLYHIFTQCHLRHEMPTEEKWRYQRAHQMAHRYCAFLLQRFFRQSSLQAAAFELRRFYHASHWQKMHYLEHQLKGPVLPIPIS